MRKYLHLFFICLMASPLAAQGIMFGVTAKKQVVAAIALVNTTSGEVGGTPASTVAATAASHTAGNLLVVMTKASSAVTVTGVADTAGNTFVQCTASAANAGGGGGSSDVWYAKNITGNGSNVVTVTFSGTSAFTAVIVHQYSVASKTAPFEVGQSGTGGPAVTSVTSGSFSPAGSGNVNVAIGTQSVGAGTWTAGTNYVLVKLSGATVNVQSEHRLAAPSGAQTASITFQNANTMTISVASFKQ
jgi:hypothetical protein